MAQALTLEDLNNNLSMIDQTLFQVIVHQNAIIESLIAKNVVSDDEFKATTIRRREELTQVVADTIQREKAKAQEAANAQIVEKVSG